MARADGTDDITTQSTTAGANTLIIATGNIGGAQVIQADQTLQGGGSTIQVRGAVTGTVLDFTAPGSRPTLTNAANSAVLTVAGSNTHITGVDVEGAGSIPGFQSNLGIFGNNGVTNVHIRAVNVTGTGQASIAFRYNTSVKISNVVLTDAYGHGIYFFDNNTVEISNATIVTPKASGILVQDNNMVSIADTTVVNPAANGLSVIAGNTVHVSRMTIENTGGHGIVLLNDNNNLNLNDSTLNGTIARGILSSANNTVSGTGNTASGATFGLGFCDAAGVTGSIAFDIGTCP